MISAEVESQIAIKFQRIRESLNERTRRLWAAAEAIALGHGGIAAVSRATGLAPRTIGVGIRELGTEKKRSTICAQRIRRPGAGRKKLTERDPTLIPDLQELVDFATRGDPESPLLWTARSVRNLMHALHEKGHSVSFKTVATRLKDLGYRLQANRKRLEGAQHPDRNAQFEHINECVRRQLEDQQPVISVDTKKKELVGNHKNGGKELSASKSPTDVEVHDFVDPEKGRAAPYGVYDIGENEGWVSVGINHDTAEFATQAIRDWWNEMGCARYPDAESLLITADAGGSNGYRLRLWKTELQKLADELMLPIAVCHFPPGTSKWNKIEHRMFSFITQNWRGKPLVSYQTIINLISSTKTNEGLRILCRVDEREYQKGRRISDKELAAVNLISDDFHGEWNYIILPSAWDESIC
jgi:hypothetical protein